MKKWFSTVSSGVLKQISYVFDLQFFNTVNRTHEWVYKKVYQNLFAQRFYALANEI